MATLNEDKVIQVKPNDLRECIRASVSGFIRAGHQYLLTRNESKLIDDFTAHLYGNVTLALIGKEVKRNKERVCDRCTEWFAGDGLDIEELSTSELMVIVVEAGYMVGDHECDDILHCVCSGHSN